MNTDPLTGAPLPSTAIQRILFLSPKVHVYHIPPLTSTKGYNAATWTADNNKRQIFTARLRILETSIPSPTASETDTDSEKVTTTILLEDPGSGQLFAAAPYTSPAVVEQALDSSRFFAVTVVGEGRKAVLGIGFEERSEAFDFSISLQDAQRVLGLSNPGLTTGGHAGWGGRLTQQKEAEEPKRDFSLKEGETISINFGGRGRRPRQEEATPRNERSETDALFSIKPPPGGKGGTMPFLPPPPSAKSVKEERRRSRQTFEQKPEDLGFDDGEFGEFQ
ncbi:adaptin ear-binding coat-associated protein 1 NECAP-1 [Lindgomyces ingoldianus]|uniref:Adaptin ear-binding coat-associated protein 1 NECAP-1 n=1 Tax=Lindgomyces ingoldianus TaxID=673940 RepID=A0ACB6R3U9_9PLEO|nr:adaptin ear-binding coat-associated protein 1 NECAP-1 [Lindgomyces ingoldianus]KAF2473989.1 adaptin ear-binding coat-associated protein 1 NECAP-1 [Lindgomyces ingoldianus]